MTGDHDRDGAGDVPTHDSHTGDEDKNPELDVEAAFAALVAQFSTPATASEGPQPWPAAENLLDAEDSTARMFESSAPTVPTTPSTPGAPNQLPDTGPAIGPLRAYGAGPQEPTYPAELDEHYEPPEPPPLPRGDLVSRLAWAAVIGGPLFLLFAALVGGDLPALMLLAALGAFIGGFVTLVARMPGEPPEDRDDGAVV